MANALASMIQREQDTDQEKRNALASDINWVTPNVGQVVPKWVSTSDVPWLERAYRDAKDIGDVVVRGALDIPNKLMMAVTDREAPAWALRNLTPAGQMVQGANQFAAGLRGTEVAENIWDQPEPLSDAPWLQRAGNMATGIANMALAYTPMEKAVGGAVGSIGTKVADKWPMQKAIYVGPKSKTWTTRPQDMTDAPLNQKSGQIEGYVEGPERDANFEKWFGKSKVVGEDGKPLTVYKGMPVNDWKNNQPIESIQRQTEFQADEGDVYVTLKPNQSKSIFNRGTFNPKDPRILYGAGAGLAAYGMSQGTANAQSQMPKYTPEDAKRSRDILNKYKKLNFVQRLDTPENFPKMDNGNGGYSTHLMASAEVDGRNIVYPTIVFDSKSKSLKKLQGKEAIEYALETGEFIPFDDVNEAEWFANNYKAGVDMERFNEKQINYNMQDAPWLTNE